MSGHPAGGRGIAVRTRVLPAVTLVLGTVAGLGTAAASRAQSIPLGSPVTLELPELGREVRREKLFDAATGRIVVQNEVLQSNGTTSVATDAEVWTLAHQNTAAYRARVGALAPRFFAVLSQAATDEPDRLFPVAVVSHFDPSTLPPGPSFEVAESFTELADDLVRVRRSEDIAALLAPATDAIERAIRDLGGVVHRASRLAPVVYAEMVAQDVLALAQDTDLVERIYDAAGQIVPELATSTCAIGSTTVLGRGISAADREIAVLESNQVDHPLDCLDFVDALGDSDIANHPTAVAGIIASTLAGTTGVAPGANILSADQDENLFVCDNLDDSLSWALDAGAEAVNMSFASDDSGEVECEDAIVDWYVRHHRRTVVKSAGNQSNTCEDSGEVTNPGVGFNTITVGNYDDMGTCAGTDDQMSTDSCFGDPESPHHDREKPEVAAPGTSITTLSSSFTSMCLTLTSSGTSFSAPHVTGTAALLMGRTNGIKWWPELMKAVLMASAFNVVGVDPRLDERAGAGGIRADAADDVLRKDRFDTLTVTRSDFDAAGWLTLAQLPVLNGVQRLKAAIAWSSNPGTDTLIAPAGLSISNDFDLALFRLGPSGAQELIATSASFDNSYETIDVPNPAPGTYVLRVSLGLGTLALPGSTATEYLAGAWATLFPCEDLGRDDDGDGMCGDTDNCPGVANQDQSDGDLDGLGDACDNCPGIANADQSNGDLDAQGDACDGDDDNDGCTDVTDHAPDSPVEPIGQWSGPLCNPSSGTEYGFAGADTDGDGILDCSEADNDDDGVADEEDPCPASADASSTACLFFRDCPGQPWWDVCQLGGCNEFLLKLVSVINPDPTIYDFRAVNQKLYVAPLVGKTLAETAATFKGGALAAIGVGPAASSLDRLEIAPRATDAPAVLVAEYDPASAQVGPVDRGTLLVVTPPTGGAPLTVEATWVIGAPPGPLPADADCDQVPDPLDNCPQAANTGQEDDDADGLGDACETAADASSEPEVTLALASARCRLAALGADVDAAGLPAKIAKRLRARLARAEAHNRRAETRLRTGKRRAVAKLIRRTIDELARFEARAGRLERRGFAAPLPRVLRTSAGSLIEVLRTARSSLGAR